MCFRRQQRGRKPMCEPPEHTSASSRRCTHREMTTMSMSIVGSAFYAHEAAARMGAVSDNHPRSGEASGAGNVLKGGGGE